MIHVTLEFINFLSFFNQNVHDSKEYYGNKNNVFNISNHLAFKNIIYVFLFYGPA